MRKINIHMKVDEVTEEYCQKVNAGVREITDSIIVFGKETSMIPHITISMGELNEQKNSIDDVVTIVKETISKLSPIQFWVHSPYLENVVNQYVFSDVDGGSVFKDLREELTMKLGREHLDNIGGSYGEQAPHLTLAHVIEKQQEVRTFLKTIKAEFGFDSNSIEISDVGPKGTSINSLYVFKL